MPTKDVKKNIQFIINPISGVGRQRVVEELLYRYLNHTLYNYEVTYTKAPHHATEIAQQAAKQNYWAVVAVGGDGSVNETAKGLINTNTYLGILPCGSGNGLARHLKIPLDLSKAIQRINNPTFDWLDAGVINNHYFFNVSGLGFDGYVAHCFSNKKKRGLQSYIKIVIKELFNYPLTKATLEFNNQKISCSEFINSFCIGSQYGNNTLIAPLAQHNDGLLEVVLVDKLLWYKIPGLLYYLATKQIHKSSLVKTFQTNKLTIFGELNWFHLDGEPYRFSEKKIEIELKKHALKIVR
jgi:YegS/Rv2252/BmrU family lipid kinase